MLNHEEFAIVDLGERVSRVASLAYHLVLVSQGLGEDCPRPREQQTFLPGP